MQLDLDFVPQQEITGVIDRRAILETWLLNVMGVLCARRWLLGERGAWHLGLVSDVVQFTALDPPSRSQKEAERVYFSQVNADEWVLLADVVRSRLARTSTAARQGLGVHQVVVDDTPVYIKYEVREAHHGERNFPYISIGCFGTPRVSAAPKVPATAHAA